MTIAATYVSANSFTVSGDLTGDFHAGRRVKADCGVDGEKFGTIQGSSYSAPDTTITLAAGSDALTANLEAAQFGAVGRGAEGGLPEHAHNGSQGEGGAFQTMTFSQMAAVTAQAVTCAASLAWDLAAAQSATLTLDQDMTLNSAGNQAANRPAIMMITQAAAASYTVSFNAAVFDLHGEAPEMPTTFDAKMLLSFVSDGTKMHLTGFWEEA